LAKKAAKKTGGPGQSAPQHVAEILQRGFQLHQEGNRAEAERLYREVVTLVPDHPDANHLLGMLAHDAGRNEDAVRLISVALRGIPDNPVYHNNLGLAQLALERKEEALQSFTQAVALKPDYALAYSNLGNALWALHRLQESAESFQKAIDNEPSIAAAHSNLGNVLLELDRTDDALVAFHKAIEIDPVQADAHSNLGNAHKQLENLADAENCYRRAIELDPGHADAWSNLSGIQLAWGNLDDAAEACRAAIAIRPDNANAHRNLANVLWEEGDLDQAMATYRAVLARRPEDADLHYDFGMTLLAMGEIAEGWAEFEWRFKTDKYDYGIGRFPQPLWDGSDLSGRSIVLWGEQGVGDELRYASMIPDLIEAGADVAIQCDPRLVDLFARSMPEAKVFPRPYEAALSGEVAFDYQFPFTCLGRFLRPTLEAFEGVAESYLIPDPSSRDSWAKRLVQLGPKPKIGVTWNNTPQTEKNRRTMAAPRNLEPIFEISGVEFINLQYVDSTHERAEIRQLYDVEVHTWDDLDLKNDLDEVAALISSLDLVIASDTAAGELAAALGVPTLTFAVGKRNYVSLGTDGAIWHPTMRIFRKEVSDSWDGFLNELAAAARQHLILA